MDHKQTVSQFTNIIHGKRYIVIGTPLLMSHCSLEDQHLKTEHVIFHIKYRIKNKENVYQRRKI